MVKSTKPWRYLDDKEMASDSFLFSPGSNRSESLSDSQALYFQEKLHSKVPQAQLPPCLAILGNLLTMIRYRMKYNLII